MLLKKQKHQSSKKTIHILIWINRILCVKSECSELKKTRIGSFASRGTGLMECFIRKSCQKSKSFRALGKIDSNNYYFIKKVLIFSAFFDQIQTFEVLMNSPTEWLGELNIGHCEVIDQGADSAHWSIHTPKKKPRKRCVNHCTF